MLIIISIHRHSISAPAPQSTLEAIDADLSANDPGARCDIDRAGRGRKFGQRAQWQCPRESAGQSLFGIMRREVGCPWQRRPADRLEQNDEVYKSQTRSFIRDWLSLLAAKKTAYVPLIVLINPSTAASGKNVFGRDKGVFGKLKADFNINKKDR